MPKYVNSDAMFMSGLKGKEVMSLEQTLAKAKEIETSGNAMVWAIYCADSTFLKEYFLHEMEVPEEKVKAGFAKIESARRKGKEELCEFIEQLRKEYSFVGFYQKISGTYNLQLKEAEELGLECNPAEIREVKEYECGWNKLQNELVVSNLRFVVQMVNIYASGKGRQDYMDLIQEGYLGLLRAVGGYDYRRGHKFSTYAALWIRQGISKSIYDHSRTIRIPVNTWRASRTIKKVEKKIQRREERENISLEKLAQKTGFPVEKVEAVKKAFEGECSLEIPFIDDDGELHFLSNLIVDSESLSPEEEVSSSELAERLRRVMASTSLTSREEYILRKKYGLNGNEILTSKEIGIIYDVTRQMIYQVQVNAEAKLRHSSEELF